MALEKEYGESLQGYDKVVVIPRRGCVGAVEEAMHYFKYGEDTDKVLFIFTFISDGTGLFNDLQGNNKYLQPNCIIDRENLLFIRDSRERGYPYEFILKEGRITKSRRFELF